jgi:putative FmdB family regulatory protein
MPLHSFHCEECDKTFELFLRTSEAEQKPACPYCQGDDVKRSPKDEQDNLTPGVCGVKKDT